jgi:hypothetical protein
MLQDAKGYMWFCTNEGVSEYDGYSFIVYPHNPDDPNCLKENRVEAIYEDRSSTLWVATPADWMLRQAPRRCGTWVTPPWGRSGPSWADRSKGSHRPTRKMARACRDAPAGRLYAGNYAENVEDGIVTTVEGEGK